jgi:hypothetical protein
VSVSSSLLLGDTAPHRTLRLILAPLEGEKGKEKKSKRQKEKRKETKKKDKKSQRDVRLDLST